MVYNHGLNDELFCDLTWFIWTHKSASRYWSNLRTSRACLSLVQASWPHAHLVAGVESQTSRAVKLEYGELIRELVELHAAVEAVAGARVHKVTLTLAFKFGSSILGKTRINIVNRWVFLQLVGKYLSPINIIYC